jgi:SAM-dependent methyltransferase
MSTCCSAGFRSAADTHFNAKIAAKELARYRKAGAGVTTRFLRDLVAQTRGADGALLDVGCGIGALTFELLEHGMNQAVAVDASTAYLAAASEEAARRGASAAIRFVPGDFLDVASSLPAAAVVALDRVICCYPSYEPLLEQSLQHAIRCFAFSYPRDVWYMRVAIAFENVLRRLRGDRFRAFVHGVDRMARVIQDAGFELAGRRQTWQWSADVYLRVKG